MNKKIKMNIFMIKIFETDSFDNFSISELKDEYINQCSDVSPIEARKFVYKQALRLVKEGVLKKIGNKNSHNTLYRKTALFSKIVFIEKNTITPTDKANQPEVLIENSDEIVINNLEKKLHRYNVDLMSAIGESEEYSQLAKLFPKMKKQLKRKHHLAKDKSSKLVGQIKAVKTLIHLQECL